MFASVEPSRSRAVSRLALLAAIAAGLAACSNDTTRFNDNPWASKPQASNSGNAGSNDVTGSIPQANSAPTHRVETSALPPPSAAPVRSAAVTPSYGGSAGIGPSQPPARQEITGSVQPRQPAAQIQPREPAQAWSWDGGTPIIVAQGETLATIAHRHGVPASTILQANNLASAAQVRPGQRLVIPRVQHQIGAAPQVSAPATRVAGPVPAPARTAAPPAAGTHVVAPGETIYSLARHYHVAPGAIARANNVGLDHRVKIGDRIVIPGTSAAQPRVATQAPPHAQPAQPAPRVAMKQETVAPAVKAAPVQKVAQAAPAPAPVAGAHMVTPAADPAPEPKSTGTTSSASTSFRWPVHGRISEGFGAKQNGGQNDGINITVPQGTPIKAAEDGVVAYAGSELKGYGNLVLVRHSNGFVTAYAHASELDVKKGETVKRGQVIGKAGATGNVSSPQLHFEVRKGATPVDPTQYLSGG
jgi:murein DD-endopeptidase MepM/ murein hydrolase activator NlpD